MPQRAAQGPAYFVIVTGMSGAGKSQALKSLEDFSFFCVDNLPLALLPRFVELTHRLKQRFRRVALCVDVREAEFAREFARSVRELKAGGIRHTILFLDADTPTLVRRYAETRRRHPLGRSITAGIAAERTLTVGVRALADKIIDTTDLSLAALKGSVVAVMRLTDQPGMVVQLVSFGYKHGIPIDADLVFDVRFLPNPLYVRRLRQLTGRDQAVKRFLRRFAPGASFLRKVGELLALVLPLYLKAGKSYVTIGIGCTGGRHRSVYVLEALRRAIARIGYDPKVLHRDIRR